MTLQDSTVMAVRTEHGYRLKLTSGLHGSRRIIEQIVFDLAHSNRSDSELVLWTSQAKHQLADLAERVKSGRDDYSLADLHSVHAALTVATCPYMFGDEESFHTRYALFRETVSEFAANLVQAIEDAS